MRNDATKTLKGLSAQKKRYAEIFKDMLKRMDRAVRILDILVENAEERFEVDEYWQRRFDAANK